MNTQFKKLCLLLTILFTFNCLYAQTDMLFWFVAPEINDNHWPGNPLVNRGQPAFLRFSNSESFGITVTVSQPATPTFTPIIVNIPANATRSVQFIRGGGAGVFDLDDIENYLNVFPVTSPAPGNKGFKGLKIEATGRMTCYYEMAGPFNMELMSLKGRNALGTEFYVPFQTRYNPPAQSANYPLLYSAIDIVATEDNTTVTIEPTADIMLILATNTQHVGNYTIVLNEGETFSVVPHGVGNNTPWDIDRNADLAGTHITSTKPIAVSTKDDLIADGTGAVDMVADQLVPVDLLGMKYIVMEGRVINNNGVNSWDNIYVIPIHDNTDIDVGDNSTIDYTIANAGTQLRIPINNANTIIAASDTILVYHVTGINPSLIPGLPTNNYNQLGGAILPTIDVCTGSYSVSFVRSYNSDFILNVMVRDGGESGFAPFFVAGDFSGVIAGGWRTASKAFTTAQIPVGVVTTLTNSNNNLFHLGIMHGSVDCFYGYFSDFNSINVVGNVGTTINVDHKACYGERVELVAYGANTYFWKADKSPSFLSDPTAQRPVIYPIEDRRYTVTGFGDCGMTDSTQINVFVADKIVANFAIDNVIACSPLDIMIENHSRDDWPVWKYQWYYGDGTSLIGDSLSAAAADTLYHTYTNTSDTLQNLKFTLVTENDFFCKDTLETDIVVKPEIHAGFTPDNIMDCNPLTVNFTDNSTGNLGKYRWIFGDGAIANAEGDTAHTYSHTNTADTAVYNVELQLTSPFFCGDTARATISVYSYLEAGFALDVDDGCSPLNVRFTNISDGEDSISLDYGDGTVLNTATFWTKIHTYINTGTSVDTNVVELHVFNDEGCEEIWRDTVIVYPEIRADYTIDNNGGNPYSGCNSRTVTFTNTSNDGVHTASRYLWEFDDGTSMDTINLPIDKFYNNTTADDKTYNFKLTARSIHGCTDDTTNSLDIYRAYADFTVDNNEGCSPLEVKVTNVSIGNQILPEPAGWDWNYGNGHTDTDKNPFPYVYNNVSAVIDTNSLILKVTGTNGCSTSDTIDIVVYPQIQVSYTENQIIVPGCDSLVVEFNSSIVNPALPSVSYSWDFGDGASSSVGDTTHVYTNLLSSTPINRAVTLHVETVQGCSDDATSNITVNPLVNAKIFIDKSTDCSPLTVDVVAQNYAGISNYSWNYGDVLPGISSFRDPTPYPYPANQSYAPQPGGDANYELVLEVNGSAGVCTDSDTVDVKIYSEVVAGFESNVTSGCNPLAVNFTDTSSSNTNSWQWDFNDGSTSSSQNPDNTFVNPDPGTKFFNVTLGVISDRGCINSIVNQISVLPYIDANFDINLSEDCSPFTITITNNSLSTGTEWYWYWDKDDRVITPAVLAAADSTVNFASFTKTFINNSGTTRTDSLTLIVGNGNGCYELFKRAITVHSTIDAQFTMSPGSGEGCNKLTVDFTNATVNGNTYNWTFGDGSSTTTESPDHEFINTYTIDRTFQVRLEAESVDRCTDFIDTTITVYSKMTSNFSIAIREDCPPFIAIIDNTSIGNAFNTYEWFIDGVLDGTAPVNKADFIHTYENTLPSIRDYQVKLIATNPHACTSEHIDTVRVYEHVEASFTMDVDEGCSPLDVFFTNISSTPADTRYKWTFGDGASSGVNDTITHKFRNDSREHDLTRNIYLTVTSANNCSDDTSMTVDIFHQPLAKFFIDNTSDCPPLRSNLSKDSKGDDMFEWRFGDGKPNNTTDASLLYEWDNTDIDNVQTYNLELWVGTTNNCKDSVSLDLTVNPKVTANFTMDKTSGCSPLKDVQFTNESTSPAVIFFWSFGVGPTSNMENPERNFVNGGSTDRIYDVYFKASSLYNCWDSITKQVTVYVQPNAEFYVDPVLLKYPNNIVNITNKTIPNPGPFDYLWDFDDGNTSSNKDPDNHLYDHWGEYAINLTVNSQTSNCSDKDTVDLLISPPDVNADFSIRIDNPCLDEGVEVEFTAKASIYAEVYDYTWDFGDGETGTGAKVIHFYEEADNYSVTMIAKGLGGDDFEHKTVQIYANPKADFQVVPREASLNASTLEARVKFINRSECNDTSTCIYTWDFGDGNTSIATDVTHIYNELGLYDIKLTATNSNGCTDSLLRYEEVEIIGGGKIQFPNAFTPNGDELNNLFKPAVVEDVLPNEYELLIYNRWGELLFKTNDLGAGWDGRINRKPGKSDVYVWKAKGKFTSGRAFEMAGDVTLIR